MNLEDKAVELLTKMDAVATQVAPEALELAKTTMQVAGAKGLVVGAIGLTIALTASIIGYRTNKKKYKGDKDHAILIACIVFSFVGYTIGISELCNIWNWVAVFRPDVAMAHKVLKF